MRDKVTSIQRFLIQNYILIFVFTAISIFLAYALSYSFITFGILQNDTRLKLEAKDIYNLEYDQINSADIESLGGWVEVLNVDYKIIFVKGNKSDEFQVYNESLLFDNFVYSTDDIDNYPYYYSVLKSQDFQGNVVYFLVKIPREAMKFNIQFESNNLPNIQFVINFIGIPIFILTSLILFILGLKVFSKRVTKRIEKPLRSLRNGIKEMEKGNYEGQLDFTADDEFMVVKDSFNMMQSNLSKTLKEKELLTKSKRDMIRNLSHDLKTPMTTIRGYAHALYYDHEKDDKARKDLAKRIYHKSINMTLMINNLFEISVLEDAEYQFKKKKLNIAEWLRVLMIEIYKDIEVNQFELIIEISEKPIYVEFDKQQMRRAVMNLIYNCLNYNPINTKILIGCYTIDNEAIIQVADNGVGIADDEIESLFKIYKRGTNIDEMSKGTGLGLAIVKSIVDRHSGTVIYERNDEYTSNFFIRLPII